MPKFTRGHKVNLGRVHWQTVAKRNAVVYMPLPVQEEVLWAAGFWEGEGSVSTRFIAATQVDRWPLERLQRSFGGNVYERIDKRGNRPICAWHLCGDAGRLFVHLIYPYLSPRRQAQIDRVFITQEKFLLKKQTQRETAERLASLRGRDQSGKFNHAKVS